MPSKHIEAIVDAAAASMACASGMTRLFLEVFIDSVRESSSKPGNRNMIPKGIEKGVLAAFAGRKAVSVFPSPSIVWGQKALVRKSLDLLVVNRDNKKLVPIEIKGNGFDGIASALV